MGIFGTRGASARPKQRRDDRDVVVVNGAPHAVRRGDALRQAEQFISEGAVVESVRMGRKTYRLNSRGVWVRV